MLLIVFSINGYAANIKGTIVDKQTGEPLPGAMVALSGTPTIVQTYTTQQACLNDLHGRAVQCVPVVTQSPDTEQDKKMKELFFNTFEKFIAIMKESD